MPMLQLQIDVCVSVKDIYLLICMTKFDLEAGCRVQCIVLHKSSVDLDLNGVHITL